MRKRLWVALLALTTGTATAQTPSTDRPLEVGVPGVVEVRWRDVQDREGRHTSVPVFYRTGRDSDGVLAQQVMLADAEYRRLRTTGAPDAARVLNEQFSEIDETGASRNRSEALRDWQGNPLSAFDMSGATIRLAGDVAVITGRATVVRLSQPATMLLTRVYIRGAGGAWELLSNAQLTSPR